MFNTCNTFRYHRYPLLLLLSITLIWVRFPKGKAYKHPSNFIHVYVFSLSDFRWTKQMLPTLRLKKLHGMFTTYLPAYSVKSCARYCKYKSSHIKQFRVDAHLCIRPQSLTVLYKSVNLFPSPLDHLLSHTILQHLFH